LEKVGRRASREDIRRFAQQLATLWGDPKAVLAPHGHSAGRKRLIVAQRIEAIRTVRRPEERTRRAPGILKLFDSKVIA